jgi:hypothetical protein
MKEVVQDAAGKVIKMLTKQRRPVIQWHYSAGRCPCSMRVARFFANLSNRVFAEGSMAFSPARAEKTASNAVPPLFYVSRRWADADPGVRQ